MKKLKIGLFDSGIGGLSIAREVARLLPFADLHYYADHAYAPYGDQSLQQIQKRAHELTQKLLEKEVSLIVVACNTATALAIDDLRKHYPHCPFVGVEPFLKAALPGKPAAVLTTPLMASSERFSALKKRLDPENLLTYIPCPRLSQLIEAYFAGDLSPQLWRQELTRELIPAQSYEYLILGCTHYPLVSEDIESVTQGICLSPQIAVAKQVSRLLEGDFEQNAQGQIYYSSTATNGELPIKFLKNLTAFCHPFPFVPL